MEEKTENLSSRGDYRITLTGDGRPGPIEERIGRRLVRLVDPESTEGLDLLSSRSVRFIGPGGTHLGFVQPDEAIEYLRKALEERIAEAATDSALDEQAWQSGLNRLEDWSRRIGQA